MRTGGCNCDRDHRAAWPKWRIGEESYQTCPRYLITDRSWMFLRLYGHYRRGFLPLRGALFEQPHVYVEAMEIIGAHVNDDPGEV